MFMKRWLSAKQKSVDSPHYVVRLSFLILWVDIEVVVVVSDGTALKKLLMFFLLFSQRLFVDAFCTEKLGVYAQDLGK